MAKSIMQTPLGDLISSTILALLAGVGASFLFAALVWLLTADAAADTREQGQDPSGSGALHVMTASGQLIRNAPRLDTDVAIQVSGMLARVTVKQTFRNPSDEWVEAIYAFPLPQDSAVDHMRMRAGEVVIEGEIREKQQARREYQQAKQQGKRASLLEQQRPNIFTSSLANVAPMEKVEVEIEYQQAILHRDGVFSLRFPMVVGPRYIPGKPVLQETDGFAQQGWALATDQVPDASAITPPVIDQSVSRMNAVKLRVDLKVGLPLGSVRSLYHRMDSETLDDGHRRLQLPSGVPANRDFVLEWQLKAGKAPGAAFFQQDWQTSHYGLLMLTPPAAEMLQGANLPPRELILVVDTSGSMHGESMQQAKAALHLALQQLREGDRFNVIQFNSSMHALFDGAVRVNEYNRRRAANYVDALQADGGTEMLSAMHYALGHKADTPALRQVVFMTDGAIGNEEALFAAIERKLGESRLFPVAIGSAPNNWFMQEAADRGRGSYTAIGDLSEVQQRIETLFRQLSAPVLTDIQATWESADGEQLVEQAPQRIPDLYAGDPLLISVKADKPFSRVVLRGRLGGAPWEHRINLKGAGNSAGVHVLWARRMIAMWMSRSSRGDDPQQAKAAIVALALEHHLVSRHTSLVAIDKTPVRPLEEVLHSKAVATHLPAGWKQQAVFGRLPSTATPAPLLLLTGLVLLLGGAWWRRRSL